MEMDKRIEKLYSDLGIEPENYPYYKDPYEFAKTFKKCSLNFNVCTSTSDSTCTNTEYNTK